MANNKTALPSPKYWDRHNEDDRVLFAKFLEPLVIAAWPSKVQRDKNFGRSEALTYMLSLQDVPRDVLALAVTKVIQAGVTWMPRPGDIKHACFEISNQRRAAAVKEATTLRAKCPHCNGTGLREVDGQNAVTPCTCTAEARKLIEAAGQVVKRPVLLPVSQEPIANDDPSW
jgi:hypothetical protein